MAANPNNLGLGGMIGVAQNQQANANNYSGALGQLGVLGHPGHAGVLQGISPPPWQPTISLPSTADVAAAIKKSLFAKAEIMEYFEAQLRMDLWKDEPVHKEIFENAMHAAFRRIQEV